MAKDKLSDTAEVADFIAALDHPLKDVVIAVRNIILATDSEVGEQIKWNSPAFCYNGEMAPFNPKEYKRDIAAMHLRKKDQVLLIFPSGAKIPDISGILEGNYIDGRRMVIIKGMAELEVKTAALKQVIRQWLDMIEK